MATPTSNSVPTDFVSISGDNRIASLEFGTKWGSGSPGTGVNLTYSFASNPGAFYSGYGFGEPNGMSPLTGSQQTSAASALAAWAHVANVTFTPSPDNTSTVGEIRFARSTIVDSDTNAAAYAYLPFNGPEAGDIWLSPTRMSGSVESGDPEYVTLLHEIGHALGLKHSFEPDTLSTATLPAASDYLHNTVMSYYSLPGQQLAQTIFPTTPMVYDILAMQYLYGANMNWNTGNNSYAFSDGGAYFQTIWDSGGTDTIQYNGTAGGVIDLREGNFSQLGLPILYSADGETISNVRWDTVAIAYGAQIENAIGGSGNDVIIGNGLNNVLSGGDGNDTLTGGAGNNSINGGSGADTANYSWTAFGVRVDLGAGANQGQSIGGEGFTDQLTGIEGAIGGSGSDLFIVRSVAPGALQAYTGNGGADTVDFAQFPSAVWIDLTYPGVEAWTRDQPHLNSGTYRTIVDVASIENIVSTAFDDYIKGDGSANFIAYVNGHDVIDAAGGSDTVDFSRFGAAVWVDLVFFGDEAWTRDGTNVLSGTWRSIADVSNAENIIGTAFDDALYATSATQLLSSGAGDDALFLRAISPGVIAAVDGGSNTAAGDTADFSAFGAAVWVDLAYSGIEGWTQDATNLLSGAWRPFADVANVENLVGSPFDDQLFGNSGANQFFYAGGFDAVDGRTGNDTLDYSRFGSAVWLDLGIGQLWTMDRADLVSGTWRQIGTLAGIENATGNAGADFLRGDANANILSGGNGNDTLIGRAGADTLAGGFGSDTASYDGSSAGVTVNLSAGNGFGGDAAGDVLTSVENLIGSANPDNLTGTAGINFLDGGAGADVMAGLGGDDTYIVDNSGDAVSENSGEGTDLVRTTLADHTLADNVEIYVHQGAGSFTGSGNGLDNTFLISPVAAGAIATLDGMAQASGGDTTDFSGFGAAVWVDLAYSGFEGWTQDAADLVSGVWRAFSDIANVENLVGTPYADQLFGNGNDNRFFYTGGYDVMDGRAGSDTFDASRFGSAVWVDLGIGQLWTMDRADLVGGTWRQIGTLASLENATGTTGADFLRGNTSANVLWGLSGDDVLIGGAGADLFLYRESANGAPTGHTTINDFVRGTDLIDIDSNLSAPAAAAALHIVHNVQGSQVTFDPAPDYLLTVIDVSLDPSDFLFT